MSGTDDQVLIYSARKGTYINSDGTEVFCDVLWSNDVFKNSIITKPDFEEED